MATYTMSEEEADDHNDYQRELAAERAEPALKRFDYTLWKIDGSAVKHSALWAEDRQQAGIQLDREFGEEWKIVKIEHVWPHLTRTQTELDRLRDAAIEEERPNQEPQDERPGAADHEVKF